MIGLATGIASVLSILGVIYGFINHKRIRVRLCGRKLSASIHIDDKTAKNIANEPVIVQPRRTPLSRDHRERRISIEERRNSVEERKDLTTLSAQY